jgi:plasmid stability protein
MSVPAGFWKGADHSGRGLRLKATADSDINVDIEVQMAQVIIRNIEDDVIERLKEKARSKGHSLEQELRDVLRAASTYSREERVALADRIRAMTPPGPRPRSEDLIREDRDSR